jgi:hypothetical protein
MIVSGSLMTRPSWSAWVVVIILAMMPSSNRVRHFPPFFRFGFSSAWAGCSASPAARLRAQPPKRGSWTPLVVLFLAQDTQLQRTVALKIPKLADDRPTFRARFLREARAAARLGHPNICSVYDADEIDCRPYLTTGQRVGPAVRSWPRRSNKDTSAQFLSVTRERLPRSTTI